MLKGSAPSYVSLCVIQKAAVLADVPNCIALSTMLFDTVTEPFVEVTRSVCFQICAKTCEDFPHNNQFLCPHQLGPTKWPKSALSTDGLSPGGTWNTLLHNDPPSYSAICSNSSLELLQRCTRGSLPYQVSHALISRRRRRACIQGVMHTLAWDLYDIH